MFLAQTTHTKEALCMDRITQEAHFRQRVLEYYSKQLIPKVNSTVEVKVEFSPGKKVR